MDIGLVGAPGSGKTELARKLQDVLAANGSVAVIDDYIPQIEQETNLSITQVCNYLGNLYVALGRYARERIARASHTDVISCGTFLDTAVYSALDITAQATILSDKAKVSEAPRAQAALMMMATLYQDIFHYDHVFYLPYASPEVHYQQFDQFIQSALASFKVASAVVLDQPTLDERLERVQAALA